MVQKIRANKLKVFSGKEAALNRVIFLMLLKKPLIPYDVWLSVKSIKGFRHTNYKTVCRRVRSLYQQGWITAVGIRATKPSGNGSLFELTLKGKAALRFSEQNIDDYLQTATDMQLLKFIEALEKSTV
ncbi:MAG: hypothetical protein ACQCN5_03875 [Candidatus Bathyarchaeia archaeon]|jgi:DNA-binding PadR family transcriptional regulator